MNNAKTVSSLKIKNRIFIISGTHGAVPQPVEYDKTLNLADVSIRCGNLDLLRSSQARHSHYSALDGPVFRRRFADMAPPLVAMIFIRRRSGDFSASRCAKVAAIVFLDDHDDHGDKGGGGEQTDTNTHTLTLANAASLNVYASPPPHAVLAVGRRL
ncbi:serine/threonine phosphatase [Colletotrichum orchidophilum]|uniref:Serine/threonine phosphatase n=1 Tax=Colletotrichum orchidophilum TaxID=1209926 RepID=A0A1G4ANX4_9PEZI|nr:serine/threonine phosphatase [Colletotrichum orchidophilum]OHE90888.1 serine/threonine phosphatase [Colletotrichum orchidophilum]